MKKIIISKTCLNIVLNNEKSAFASVTRLTLWSAMLLVSCISSTAARAENQKFLYGLVDPRGHLVLEPKYEKIDRFISHQGIRVEYKGKWGLFGHSGKFVLKPIYEDLRPVRGKDWIASAKLDGKWGLIDRTRRFSIKPKYDKPFSFVSKTGQARIVLNGKHGIIDQKDRFVIKPRYEELARFLKDGLARVKLNGLYGYVDQTGKTVVKPQYEAIRRFRGDSGKFLAKRNGKWGLINAAGETLINFKYEFIQDCHDRCGATGFLRVTLDKKIGIIDRNEHYVIKPLYEQLGEFDNVLNLALVKINGRYGYIDPDGRMIIRPKFHMARPFYGSVGLAIVGQIYDDQSVVKGNGFVSVVTNPGWGLIDAKGRYVVEPKYDRVSLFDPLLGLYEIRLNGKSGIIDRKGKVLLKPEFARISTHVTATMYSVIRLARSRQKRPSPYTLRIEGGRVSMESLGRRHAASAPGKAGLINRTAKILLEPVYEDVRVLDKDRVLIKQGGKWGLMTLAGEFVIQPKYDRLSASYGEPGVLEAELRGKHGLVDYQGNNIIEPKYDKRVFFFKDVNWATAELNGKWGMIDRNGKMVIQPKYEGIESLAFTRGSKLAPVKLNGRWGLIDFQENIVVAPRYSRIERLSNGYYLTSVSPDATRHSRQPNIERPRIRRSIEATPEAMRRSF